MDKTLSFAASLTNKTAAMIAMGAYKTGVGNPPVLLGPLPLYRVKHFEVARSQEVTEFRAIGAAFLGQQKGGNLGIRIDCEYDQTEIMSVLAILYMLEIGRGEEVEYKVPRDPLDVTFDIIEKKVFNQVIPTAPSLKYASGRSLFLYDHFLSMTKQISNTIFSRIIPGLPQITNVFWPGSPGPVDIRGMMQTTLIQKLDITANNVVPVENSKSLAYRAAAEGKTIANTNDKDADWRRTVKHRTFPILTQYEIIFDCFVETVMFKRNVKDGKNVITVSILCRQYQPEEYPKSEALFATQERTSDDVGFYDEETSKLQSLITMAPTVEKVEGKLGKVLDWVGLNSGSLSVDWLVNAAYRTGILLFRRNLKDELLRERQVRNMGVYTYLLDTIRQRTQKRQTVEISHSIEKRNIIATKTATGIVV